MFVKNCNSIMKKFLALCSFMVLFMAITCEDEPVDFEDEVASCQDATTNTVNAATAFTGATEENYNQLCIAYKNALQSQIAACGDTNDTLQTLIDSLECEDTQPTDCETATIAADAAKTTFENATDDTYEAFCMAYKAALESKIEHCGDEDGSIQTIVDELGDCIDDTVVSNGEITLSAGSSPQTFDIITVEQEGDTLKVTGKSSANGASNYEVYFEVTEGATGTDIINDSFYLTLISTFTPSTQGFEDYTSEITNNSTGVVEGTFWGTVVNADNGNLSLTSGVINITY